MTVLAGADYGGMLELLRVALTVDGHDPFPEPVLQAFQRLIPCDVVSYGDFDSEARGWRSSPAWVGEPRTPLTDEISAAHARLKHQDPLPPWGANAALAMRYSDVVSNRELRRLDLYWECCQPLGAEYQLRLWLVTTGGVLGGFDFDLARRDFSERDQLTLDTLAPHLAQLYRQAAARRSREGESDVMATLSSREREVLRLVADGQTNPEIAAARDE